jgi:hypothetical protein
MQLGCSDPAVYRYDFRVSEFENDFAFGESFGGLTGPPMN